MKLSLSILAFLSINGCVQDRSNETQFAKQARQTVAEQRARELQPLSEMRVRELQEEKERQVRQQPENQKPVGHFVRLENTRQRSKEILDCLETVDNTFNEAVRSKGQYVLGKGYFLLDVVARELRATRDKERVDCDSR